TSQQSWATVGFTAQTRECDSPQCRDDFRRGSVGMIVPGRNVGTHRILEIGNGVVCRLTIEALAGVSAAILGQIDGAQRTVPALPVIEAILAVAVTLDQVGGLQQNPPPPICDSGSLVPFAIV